MSTYPRNRDLGQEYQQGIFDTVEDAFDMWLQSGMGLLNPNNPAVQSMSQPLDTNAPLSSLLDDAEAMESLTLDPGGMFGGTVKGAKALAKAYKAPKVSKSKAQSASVVTGTKYTPPSNTYFNLQNLDQPPSVPQKDLPRREPTKGAKETFEPYVTRKTMNRMNEAVDKGIPMGGMEWFNLQPLRAAFINEYGPQGDQMFQNYIKINAPMSIQDTVPKQIRRGQYFYNRFLDDPATFTDIENAQLKGTGYGHIGLKNMKDLAKRQLTNQVDINKGQKIPSYTQNLQGNYRPITGDVHNVRLFTNMEHLDSASPEAYKIIEQPQQIEAARKGLEPAQYQASAWIGGGDITGLKSRPIPFMEIYDNMLRTTAQKMGVKPKDLLKDLLRGKANFLAIPFTAAASLNAKYGGEPEGLLSTEE
tara:strand:- start:27482 stop:28735 length:1254 start_codon:yes stop_codon:yes gene_type:complete